MFTVKITKINQPKDWLPTGVHFKVNDENYFLHYSGADYENIVTLYKGRNKGHLTFIARCHGFIEEEMIRFIRKPRCLKYVDTEHFVKRLKEKGLWKGELELL